MGYALNIVLLDSEPALGFSTTAEGEDLELHELEALGPVTKYRRTAPDQVIERAREADVLVINKIRLTDAEFAALPRLRLVSITATGTDNVDVEAAKARGVVVSNVPAYGTDSTAQHAFALLLELTNQVGLHAEDVRKGSWSRAPSFAYALRPLVELSGRTLGVVGYGAIGRRVAAIAEAFGMSVLIHSRTPVPQDPRFVTKRELLERSDVVSLHLPLAAETKDFIDAEALAQMKPGSYLINVARGGLLDERAVRAALDSGHLGGLGADVLSQEPPRPDHPLLTAPRTLLTPHIAWATRAARARLLAQTVQNIRAFAEGTPRNVVG